MRRVALALMMLCLVAPARAANHELDRLQIQVSGLQNQLAELQRTSEESVREVRRLNEQLAEQNASIKKALQDQRVQEEALASAIKDLNDRLAEMN